MDEGRRRSEVTSKIGEETGKKKNARKLKNGYNGFDEHRSLEIENLIPLVREKWYSLIH
jgi:hypothetical protein